MQQIIDLFPRLGTYQQILVEGDINHWPTLHSPSTLGLSQRNVSFMAMQLPVFWPLGS